MGSTGGTGNLRWMAITVSGLAVAVAAPLVLLAVTDDDPGPSLTYEVAPASSSTSTTRPRPTTTTIATQPIGVDELPGRYTRVVATDHGIVLAVAEDPQLPFRSLTHDSTTLAFGIGEARVVAQELGWEGSGRIVVLDQLAEHEVFPEPSAHSHQAHELHDVGFVGGRAYALVSSSSGFEPADWDSRVLLVDLETLRRLDLGRVAEWEQQVESARLLPNGDVVVLVESLAGGRLERRRLDGTTTWTVPLPGDQPRSMTLHHTGDHLEQTTVAVLEPSPGDGHSHPSIRVRHMDVETGAEATPTHLVLEGALIPNRFCEHAEAARETLLCDQWRSGPPLRIDLRDGDTHPEPGAPPYGTMTTWRFDS